MTNNIHKTRKEETMDATDTRKVDLDGTLDAIVGMQYTLAGVHGHLGREGHQITHTASARGRRSEAYRNMRRMLGDDYTTTFDETPEAIWEKAAQQGRIKYFD